MSIKQVFARTGGWLYLNTRPWASSCVGAGVILMLHRVLNNDRAAELALPSQRAVRGARSV